MYIFTILFSAVLLSWVSADDSCPAGSEIAPCTCDGEGVNCMAARTVEEVKSAFQANFKYGSVRGIWIQGTPITSIPKDLFSNVKSQQFYIEVNDITSVDIQAFDASVKTLSVLSLYGNKINDVDYSAFSQFPGLLVLNLGRNQITSIPSLAFNSRSISQLLLTQNKISNIGMNAFSNLPKLTKLELSWNALVTLGPMSLAFKSNPNNLEIFLTANRISSVSDTAFQGVSPQVVHLTNNKLTSLPANSFANLVTSVGRNGGFIEVTGNPLSCIGCDYRWIVTNKAVLPTVLRGFICKDGKSIQDLNDDGIQCKV